MSKYLRTPQARKQGLKILAYGEEGSGKSVFGLGFPKVAVIDAESKLGVYESDQEYGRNLVAVADTSNYYETNEVIKECVENKVCDTLLIDSETYIYEGVQVSCMEVEEARAKKKKSNIDDATIAQRGYGKIKLNAHRLKLIKAQASAKGITIISTAHKEDIMQKIGEENVKIGEKPALRKNSKHDFDVILRFYKGKDIGSGSMKYFAEVEKDATRNVQVGQIIENPTYELFRTYIEKNSNLKTINATYDKNIEQNMQSLQDEQQSFEEVLEEFQTLFKKLKSENLTKSARIPMLLKEKGVNSINNPEHIDAIKEIIAEMKKDN